jgi:hypothetical protein
MYYPCNASQIYSRHAACSAEKKEHYIHLLVIWRCKYGTMNWCQNILVIARLNPNKEALFFHQMWYILTPEAEIYML